LLNLFSFLLHRFSRVGPWDLCKLERTGQVHAKLCICGHRALDKSLWRVLKEFVMKQLMIHVRKFYNRVCKFRNCSRVNDFCNRVSFVIE
jgi:hypothetical protein